MPLRAGGKRRSDATDSGCDTLDSNTSNTIISTDQLDDETELHDDEDDGGDDLLESLGIEDSEIKRINKFQVF